MKKSSLIGYLSVIVVVAGLSGCATKQTAELEAPADLETAAREPGLAQEPGQPLSIADLAGRISRDGRATYSGAGNSYRFYAGGDVAAEYSLTDETLAVSDVSGNGESCRYSLDGVLQGGPDEKRGQAEMKKRCQGLVERLSGYFSE